MKWGNGRPAGRTARARAVDSFTLARLIRQVGRFIKKCISPQF